MKELQAQKTAVIQPFCVLSILNKWGWSSLCCFCSLSCSLFLLCKRSYGLELTGRAAHCKLRPNSLVQRVALYILTQDSTQAGILDTISMEEHRDSLNHDLRVPFCLAVYHKLNTMHAIFYKDHYVGLDESQTTSEHQIKYTWNITWKLFLYCYILNLK